MSLSLLLLFSPSLANAEIKVTPPLNWQPRADNNATSMVWDQNSTKSLFSIIKGRDNPLLPIAFLGPAMAQNFADRGVLESTDQITFGHSNFGYRFFLDLSSPSKLNSSGMASEGTYLSAIPKNGAVPFKVMLILSHKQGDLYAIYLQSPKLNFDSILNQIKPTLDSIELNNSTALSN